MSFDGFPSIFLPNSWPSAGSTSILAFVAGAGLLTLQAIYAVTFHSLAAVPGPRICAISRFPYWIQVFRGHDAQWLHKLHEQYGPTVRYGPEDLSYSSTEAWRDIHGHSKGHPSPPKADDYGMQPANGVRSILTCDDENHARVRRVFAPAFSDRALRQQQPVFKKYVGLLIETMNRAIRSGRPSSTLDMTRYLNFTTFDIMADLCFGHPLGMLEKNEFSPWVSAIFDMITLLPVSNFIEYHPALSHLLKTFEPKWLRDTKSDHFRHSADRVDQRLKEGTDRPDFWNFVLSREQSGEGLSLAEMHSNAELFMLAGTETTATALSGILYFLCVNRDKLELLVREVRDSHRTTDDMTLDSLAKLPYLNACIKEGLRMYPPVPAGAPRIVQEGGISIAGQWVPGGTRVILTPYAAFRSTANFVAPDTFAPERWLAGHGGGRFEMDRREACQPFSTGPRNCLGQNMALHESRLILASLLLHFEFELCEESWSWMDQKAHALWLKKPLMCRVTPLG